jgi:hypothetical protein
MGKDKYKVLVLSDLNTSAIKTLKSSVSIAKIVNADIDFFYVKKATDVVEKESQLSAMRTINKEYFTVDKKIKELISPISESYNININHSFIIGNVKNEIEKYIDKNKPDIVVLGKRKSKITNFIGDNIAQFILKKYDGTIVISDEKNPLKPNDELSLGIFNHTEFNNVFKENILNATQKPVISFKISESSKNLKEEIISENNKTVEYVFEKGDNVIKNISNYLSKSNVNLLFVNRENDKKNAVKPTINEVINNLNCSLILTT